MQQSHTLSAFLYAISNGIERASYYGIRSILFLYMVGESLQMENTEALSFYGSFALSLYISKVIGAALGDLLIGNKMSILVGGIMQAFGCIMLCFPGILFLYMGAGLLVLGNGLFSPNVLAQFGKQYHNKPKLVDAGFSGLFFFINVGAFFGVMIIGLISTKDYSNGFILGGVLMLIATLIAYFSKDNTTININENRIGTSILKKVIFIIIAIVLSGIFWACYETSIGLTTSYIFDSGLEYNHWITISSSLGIAFSLILAIVWTFVYSNQFSKFCIGLIISALAISYLISYPESLSNVDSMTLIISGLLLALGESFISPMLYAITTRYANPKYLALLLSLVSLPVILFYKVPGLISELNSESNDVSILIAVTSALVFFGIIAFIMWFVQKRDDDKLSSQNEIIE